jgi:hypothetical protein
MRFLMPGGVNCPAYWRASEVSGVAGSLAPWILPHSSLSGCTINRAADPVRGGAEMDRPSSVHQPGSWWHGDHRFAHNGDGRSAPRFRMTPQEG